jgi:ABC-type glycerol-3-phosphate transport system substrate-binding protein
MINKKMRFMASILSLGILLSGCGSKQTKEKGNTTPTDTKTTTGSKISEKERTLTVLMTDSPTQPLKNYAPAQQEIFKKTNIKLEYQIVPSSNYNDKKNILLASNNMPDIAYISSADIVQYGSTGIFLPLKSYIDKMPNFKKFWSQYPDMSKYLVGGELYAFQVVARDETANGFGPIIRTDLLQKNNLQTPTTFDELLDTLTKLKKVYPDTKPWTGRKGTTQLLTTTAYMLGSGYGDGGLYYDFDVDGGKYICGTASKEFKKVLEYLNKAYKAGVLDPDFATTTAEQFDSKMSSGKSLFFIDNSGFSLNYTKALKKIDAEAKLQAIPYLKNSAGQRRAVAYATTLAGRFYAINAKVKDPDTVIKFMDWMYGKEGSDISNYGAEGVSFQYNSKNEPEFIKDYVMKFKDATPSSYYAVFSDMGITKLNFSLWAGNTRQTFEIEKLAGNWDALSDEYWNLMAKENEKGGAFVQPIENPPLSEKDAERVKQLKLDLNTMLNQEFNKYIMGVEPIDNWDKVIEKQVKLGARELEKIYNDANAAYKK